MTIAHFPNFEELAEMVEEMYGGGTYAIHAAGSPKVFKKYEVDSPSKFLTGGPKQKSVIQIKKDELLQEAWSWWESEADAETREKVIRAILEEELREMGVQLPPPPTIEEEQLQEALEEDPELRKQYRQQLLEKHGYKKGVDPESLDQFIANYRKFKELQELLDERSGSLKEFMKESGPALVEIFQAFTKSQSVGGVVENASETSTPQPVQAAPQPEPNVGNARETVPHTAGIKPIIPYPTTAPANPPPQNSSEPSQSPFQTPLDAQSLGDKKFDLTSLWSDINWSELERGVHSDPTDFMRQLQDSSTGDNNSAQFLGQLFKDHEPSEILDVLNMALDSCVDDGRAEDYEIGVVVLMHLRETVVGRDWLAKAHATASQL